MRAGKTSVYRANGEETKPICVISGDKDILIFTEGEEILGVLVWEGTEEKGFKMVAAAGVIPAAYVLKEDRCRI